MIGAVVADKQDIETPEEAARRRRQRFRSLAIGLGLALLVLLFYAATIVRLGGNVMNRGI